MYANGAVNSVQQVSDGGYVTVGGLNGDVFLLKTDMNGDTLWTTTYGSPDSDVGLSIRETTDNGYVIAGVTRFPPGTQSNVYIVKTEPDTFGIVEDKAADIKNNSLWTTIFSGPLLLPEGINCKVFNITGRSVVPERMKPGIYFIEIDGMITQKVVKIR